ncbi:MAG: site-specific integrase [Clostridia bacterium]|nr:site-specific integrase [Clostridia bacterium]
MIKKNKDGSYSIRVYAGRDDEKKQLFLRDTVEGLKQAKARERELEQEVENSKPGVIKNKYKLFSKFFDEWIEIKKTDIEINTYNTYLAYGTNHMKPFFKDYKVGEIEEFDIKRYIAYLLSDVPIDGGIKKKKKLSSTTAAKHFYVLQEILTDALKNENPILYMKAPKVNVTEPELPSEEDLIELLGIVGQGTDDEIIIWLAAWDGLCEAEIFALKWTDVFFDACKIRVDKSLKKRSKDQYDSGTPKTNNRIRTITVQPELIDLLKAKRSRDRITNFDQTIFCELPHVFADRFRYIVKKKMKKNFTFHNLRHYHASDMYDENIPDQYAAERLGHNVQTLKRVYQHLKKKKQEQLDEQMKSFHKKQAKNLSANAK